MVGSTIVTDVLTPTSIASAVWDVTLADHQQDGSSGKYLTSAAAGGVDIDALIAALSESPLPANMTQVRGQTLTGTGTDNDPWRPA